MDEIREWLERRQIDPWVIAALLWGSTLWGLTALAVLHPVINHSAAEGVVSYFGRAILFSVVASITTDGALRYYGYLGGFQWREDRGG